VEDGWGKGVAGVRIEAFGCKGSGSVRVVERKNGSGWFLNHSFSVNYTVTATISAQPTERTVDETAQLKQLIGFVHLEPNGSFENSHLYQVALREFKRIGPRAEPALPYLIKVITGNTIETLRDLPYKGDLIDALGAIGKNNSDVISTFHAILTNKDMSPYYQPTILTLRKIGPSRQGVMSALIATLSPSVA
jgi:hypothetical protein